MRGTWKWQYSLALLFGMTKRILSPFLQFKSKPSQSCVQMPQPLFIEILRIKCFIILTYGTNNSDLDYVFIQHRYILYLLLMYGISGVLQK